MQKPTAELPDELYQRLQHIAEAKKQGKPIKWGSMLLGIGKGTWGSPKEIDEFIKEGRKDRKLAWDEE